MYKTAFNKYDINESKMKRYAAEETKEVEKLINISLAK
jgi:hypothetical protein